jgi:hypothetical protein
MIMSSFVERERAEEARFAHNEELVFKARARRNKLLGQWAAGKLGLTGKAADDYAISVVTADLAKPGDDDVIEFLVKDLAPAGIAEHTIRHELADLMAKALNEIKNG